MTRGEPGDGDGGAEGAVPLPIDGTLDLHAFHPRDVKALLGDWLDACRERGIREVRIIHGKGTGALRETVHAVLRRRPDVRGFTLAGDTRGEWGATLAELDPGADRP